MSGGLLLARGARWARLAAQAMRPPPSPPFLILFVTSQCNMRCPHCFAWPFLNRRDDLTSPELARLAASLGPVENLYISGGEPFLRRDLAAVCRRFVEADAVRRLYITTNGSRPDRVADVVEAILASPAPELLVIEVSLDGLPVFHDTFRDLPGAFARAMASIDALAGIRRRDARLRIHVVSTATAANVDEIERLSRFLFERCPAVEHHDLALLRGESRSPDLAPPDLDRYRELAASVGRLWAPKDGARAGAIVDPMLQWAKVETARAQRQVLPCLAGRLVGVVFANGDVGICEGRPPIGNLRSRTFPEIWTSREADEARASVARRECHCTGEAFLWPSLAFHPVSLVRALIGSRAWRRPATPRGGEPAGRTGGGPAS